MATVLAGKHKGKKVTLAQWANDWFTVQELEGQVYSPVSLKFTKAEKTRINKTKNKAGQMFEWFEWNGLRMRRKTKKAKQSNVVSFPGKTKKKGKKPPKKPKLSPQRLKFIENLSNGMNQTKAYQDAYPDASAATARANASTLLTNTNISEELEKRKQRAAHLADVRKAQVLGETAAIAFGDIADALTDWGTFSFELAKAAGVTHLIKKIKPTMYGTEVEFYNKADALAKLGNYLGMNVDAKENPADWSEEKQAQKYFEHLSKKGYTDEKIAGFLTERFPTVDIPKVRKKVVALLSDSVN